MRKNFIKREYKNFKGEILEIPGRTAAFFFLLTLCLLPILSQHPYLLLVLTYMNIYAIYAASWDVLGGYTGQFSMGQGAFFGVAAYSAGLLNIHLGVPFWLTIPCGAIVGVASGLIIALPALKIRGVYFSLVSLAYPIILTGFVFAFSNITGGEMGLSGITAISNDRIVTYYISLVIMIISVLTMWKFTDANSKAFRIGIVLQAIREDEISARCSGINTINYKLMAFGVSAFFAGIAGGLYVHVIRIIGPSTLELMWSFNPIIWTIFGGMGSIGGAVAGVFILYPFMEVLRIIPEFRMLIFAGLIIGIILFMPEGIISWARDKIERECPRCKIINYVTRQRCRACDANISSGRIFK
jgi:branched-chain amino acid transport system permease protein